MKTARNISWEIRGRRLVDGALREQHVAVGFGPDAASAIRWARRHQPANTSAFPDADLRAIPDPLGPDFGVKQSPFTFPTVSCLLAGLVVFAGNFEANGGDSISAGFSADGQATRAGAGMVAAPTRTGFESLLHKTAGPAENLSPSPEVFHRQVGLSADLPSVGSTRGVGNFFDRDTVAALLVFGCSIGALIWSGTQLDRKDDAESAKAIQDITRTYDL